MDGVEGLGSEYVELMKEYCKPCCGVCRHYSKKDAKYVGHNRLDNEHAYAPSTQKQNDV